MADIREVFPVLVDQTTDEGVALTASIEGDAASGKTGLVGFSFKSSSGNLVLPTLTSDGRLPVDVEDVGVSLRASSNGVVAGSLTNVTIAEIDLAFNKRYGKMTATGSCFRESIFDVVFQNGATETILGSFLVGPGSFTYTWIGGETEIVAGATGTQRLVLRARNLQKVSDLRGNIATLEYL